MLEWKFLFGDVDHFLLRLTKRFLKCSKVVSSSVWFVENFVNALSSGPWCSQLHRMPLEFLHRIERTEKGPERLRLYLLEDCYWRPNRHTESILSTACQCSNQRTHLHWWAQNQVSVEITQQRRYSTLFSSTLDSLPLNVNTSVSEAYLRCSSVVSLVSRNHPSTVHSGYLCALWRTWRWNTQGLKVLGVFLCEIPVLKWLRRLDVGKSNYKHVCACVNPSTLEAKMSSFRLYNEEVTRKSKAAHCNCKRLSYFERPVQYWGKWAPLGDFSPGICLTGILL